MALLTCRGVEEGIVQFIKMASTCMCWGKPSPITVKQLSTQFRYYHLGHVVYIFKKTTSAAHLSSPDVNFVSLGCYN